MPGKSGKSRRSRGRPRQKRPEFPSAPPALARPPQTDLAVHVRDLDKKMFPAVDAVADRLTGAIEASTSIDEINLLMTKAHLLLAMKSTHRSIRRLVSAKQDEPDLTVDAMPLTRVQLERCFLCLLLEDHPDRWHKRYRKNAWKAFAEKFLRDRCALGHFEQFQEYFGPSGKGISALRSFAREMYVWEDELQTLRCEILGEKMDPRWKKRHIADMPNPGKTIGLLEDETRKKLACLIYPYYDSLSHFSHGGLVGAMEAAILRPDQPPPGDEPIDQEAFWSSSVLEMTLPFSYVGVLFAATLMYASLGEQEPAREALEAAWRPYHSDGSALGVAIWDLWAGGVLTATAG